MKRKIRNVCFIAGSCLIILSLLIFFAWAREDHDAGVHASDAMDEIQAVISENQAENEGLSPDYELFAQKDMPQEIIDGDAYIGYLDIPSLSLRLSVLSEWSMQGLKKSVCRYSGSAYTSDLVICGHSYQTHFGSLQTLEHEDEVILTDMDGNQFSYQIQEIEILAPDEIVQMCQSGYDLTLFSCTFDSKARITVRCNEQMRGGDQEYG